MPVVTAKNIREKVGHARQPQSRLHTDESNLYPTVGEEFASHETVKHTAKKYARGDVNTNSVEGFFGIFKRGMGSIYQHCGEQHLQRYLDEFACAGERGRPAQADASILQFLTDQSDLQRVEIKGNAVVGGDRQHLAENAEDALLAGIAKSQEIKVARAAGCVRQPGSEQHGAFQDKAVCVRRAAQPGRAGARERSASGERRTG